MKIEFYSNNKEENEKNKVNSLNLKDLLLWKTNFRYTVIKDFNIDLLNKIKEEEVEKIQNNIFLELLIEEGNFFDLKELLYSILDNSFSNSAEPILLVKNNENSYTVAEGNRRTMILKLIFNHFQMPDWENIKYIPREVVNQNSEEIFGEKIEAEERRKNYEKCSHLVGELKNKWKNQNIKILIKFINNNDELWAFIFDRHITGERTGMRKWPRAKYFADLLSIFPKFMGMKTENKQEIYKKIGRQFNRVREDYREAQFIYYCFFYGFNNENHPDLEKNFDPYIIEKIKSKSNISALEMKFSIVTVRKILMRERGIDTKEFRDKFFDLEINKNTGLLKINLKNFSQKQFKYLLSYIFEVWEKRILSTRGVKEKNLEEFSNTILNIFDNIPDTNNFLTEKELNNLDEFNLTIKSLENLINANEGEYDKKFLKRFTIAKEIKENREILIQKIKEKKFFNEETQEPKDVFKLLKDQWESLKDKFVNGKAATTRSLFEQMTVWIGMYIKKDEKIDYEKDLEEITKGNIYRLSDLIRKQYFSQKGTIVKNLKKIYVKNFEDSDTINKHANFIIDFFKKNEEGKNLAWKVSKYEMINEFIHASHRLYSRNSYEKYFQTLKDWEIFIAEFIDNIEWSHFEKINKEIKNSLEANKKLNIN